jgi:hypothetical protein
MILYYMNIHKFLKLIPALAISFSALLAGLILYYIIRYGVDVPYMDQWEYIGFFDRLSMDMLTFEELARQHNEYRKFFPNLIMVGLGWFTDWNVRYEMIVIFLLACLASFNIYRLASITTNGASWAKWLMFFLANLFIFSPMQWENWLFGVQIEYFLPVACITGGFVIAYTHMDARLKFLIVLTLAGISTFSSVNGMIAWVLLYPVLIFADREGKFFKRLPIILLWILVAVISLGMYFKGYHKPESHPSLEVALQHPFDALYYFLGTVGNTLRVIHSVNVIIVVGGVLTFIFAAQMLYVLWHIRDKQFMRNSVVWIMLGLYSLLTSAMLMIGRAGYGVAQSLASRYTSFTLFAAVSMIFLTYIIVHHQARGRRIPLWQKTIMGLVVAFLIFTKINTYPLAVTELKGFHATIQHGKAGLLFINYVSHEACENRLYPANFGELKRKANILNGLGYIRPALIQSNVLQEIEAVSNHEADYGTLQSIVWVNDSTYQASGISAIPHTNQPADAVLISYDNIEGKSVLLTLCNVDSIQWHKTFSLKQISQNPVKIHAWALDANTGKAYRMQGKAVITR